MAFNAGSIVTSLDFEWSSSAKKTLAQYESALKKIDAKKVSVELDTKADMSGLTKFEREVKDADKLKADAELSAKMNPKGFQDYEKAGDKAKKTSDDVEKSNKRTSRSFGGAAKSAAGYAAGFVGAAGVISVLKSSVDSASSVSESLAKNKTLFGQASEAVTKFSESSAKSFGISQRAALEYTGIFGNLYRSVGVGQKEAAKGSVALTKLAADLASFNNTSIDEALTALRAGLVGETEPLKRFGVTLSAVAIQAEAAREGIVAVDKSSGEYQLKVAALEKAEKAQADALKEKGKRSVEYKDASAKVMVAQEKLARAAIGADAELTAQEKTLAIQSLLFKQTALAQGDFARTSGGLANQTRIMTASFEDAQMKLGTALVPAMLALVKVINAFNGLSPGVKKTILAFAGLTAVAIGISKIVSAVMVLKQAFIALKAAQGAGGLIGMLSLGPQGLIIMAAIAAIAAGAYLIIKNWDKVKAFLGKLWNWMKNAAKDAADFVGKAARKGFLGPVPFIIANWGKVKSFLGNAWGAIKSAAKDVGEFVSKSARKGFLGPVPFIISRWGDIKDFFKKLPSNIVGFLANIGNKIVRPFSSAFALLRKSIRGTLNWIKNAFEDTVEWLRKAYDKLPGFAKKGISLIGKGLSGAGKGLKAVGGLLGLSEGGKVGPGEGGAQLFVAGEGNAPEYVLSFEGDRKKNIGYAMEFLAEAGVEMFRKGGKTKKKGKKAPSSKSLRKQIRSITKQQEDQDLAKQLLETEAGFDGATSSQEAMGINAAEGRMLDLYAKERDRISQLRSALDRDMSRVRGQIGTARGSRREKLKEKLQAMKDEKKELNERLKELNSTIKLGQAQLNSSQNAAQRQAVDEEMAGAGATRFDDAITLAKGQALLTGDNSRLAELLGSRLEELRSRLSAAISQGNPGLTAALSDAFSSTQGELDSLTSAGNSSLGFTQQVANLTSSRMGLYQQAGNSFGGSMRTTTNNKNVTLNISGLQKVSDPHLWARRVGAELAMV